MDEQQPEQPTEPKLRRPEEAVEDLEPVAEDAEAVKGGAVDSFDTFKGP
jgi:hypothetical protein